MVNPEGDPGEHDDQDGRQVSLEHEVADIPLQLEAQRQALVLAYMETVWVVYFIIQYYISAATFLHSNIVVCSVFYYRILHLNDMRLAF